MDVSETEWSQQAGMAHLEKKNKTQPTLTVARANRNRMLAREVQRLISWNIGFSKTKETWCESVYVPDIRYTKSFSIAWMTSNEKNYLKTKPPSCTWIFLSTVSSGTLYWKFFQTHRCFLYCNSQLRSWEKHNLSSNFNIRLAIYCKSNMFALKQNYLTTFLKNLVSSHFFSQSYWFRSHDSMW